MGGVLACFGQTLRNHAVYRHGHGLRQQELVAGIQTLGLQHYATGQVLPRFRMPCRAPPPAPCGLFRRDHHVAMAQRALLKTTRRMGIGTVHGSQFQDA